MALQNLAATQQPGDPVIDFDDIQGDILVGLQKKVECFIFFRINDARALKAALSDGAFPVTSVAETMRREQQIAAHKASGNSGLLALWGFNIGFTHAGIQALGAVDSGMDPSFVGGAHVQAAGLGDDVGDWPLEAFKDGSIDGVMLIAGPGPRAALDAQIVRVLTPFGRAIVEVHRQYGAVRTALPEHEFFGFLDGVSQPGIRGLTARENAGDVDQGLPGQDLLWPGEFVFGYPGQDQTDPKAQGPMETPPQPWMRNGAYMVWRQLEQHVLHFKQVVATEANTLGMSADLLAARLVGRWPSGAPLVLSPLADDPRLGGDRLQNNDFEYEANDPLQKACPYAAHIRKTYPRDDLNAALGDPAGEAAVQTSRIRRAGIPYGDEVSEKESVGKEEPRGLLFVCYQTNLQQQFEFIQQSWANNPSFVVGKQRPASPNATVVPGHDLIIGQGAGRFFDEPRPSFPPETKLQNIPQFVVSRAGAYFFMPSLSALRNGLT